MTGTEPYRAKLLVLLRLVEPEAGTLAERHEALFRPGLKDPAGHEGELADVEVALTSSFVNFSEEMIEACPKLSLLIFHGSGTDGMRTEALKARGIRVVSGRGANAVSVADHAMALMLGTLRQILALDRFARSGASWNRKPIPPGVAGRTAGIVGMGEIGTKIARRLEPFGLTILYTARTPKPDLPWTFVPDVAELATRSTVLFLACSGGPETHHLVDEGVLSALGTDGYLINVSRGSVVDTPALIDALEQGSIAGAGLDVAEGEPHPDPRLLALENTLITPHAAAASPQSRKAAAALVLGNIEAHFSGAPLLTPVL